MDGALKGVRILDLTTMVSGPVATMMLADQGADVIKVESPSGDLMRKYGSIVAGVSSSFLSCNRGKRGLCVDLKLPSGLEIIKRLAATADVLVQNFRPGAMERIGLGEDAIRKIRPDIIYVSISGVGETGPYAHQRIYDPVIQALSGLAELQADRESTGRPRMVRTIIPDKTTALTAAQAISSALYYRERSGEGQHIRIAMLDAMVAYLWPEAISSLTFVGRERDPASGQMGLDLVFSTMDGYITAGALSDQEWLGMCRALEREDLVNDARFISARARTENGAARRQITSDELKKWNSADILKRLDALGVPCAPIVSRMELLDNDQVRENDLLHIFDDPRLGQVRQPRPAAMFDKSPSSIRRLAPWLGGHNAEILQELGYSATQFAQMQKDGIVLSAPAI
jgi:crotonobetainyl-CoA:carnitine CoA-transferase CaiB-like acyl-CoA transferase